MDNPISCYGVMQQKVAEGMDDFVPQGVWNGKHAAIYNRPYGSCGDRFHRADTATNAAEKSSASHGQGICGEGYLAGWSHRAADDFSKVVAVREAKFIGL